MHSGGQAVVGIVGTPAGGPASKLEDQPHAKQIAYTFPAADVESADIAIMWPKDSARASGVNVCGRSVGYDPASVI
jgi:hypothetical protein